MSHDIIFKGGIRKKYGKTWNPVIESMDGTIVIEILPSDHAARSRVLLGDYGFKSKTRAKKIAEAKAKLLGIQIAWHPDDKEK